MTALDSDYYDRWYTDVIRSPVRDRIVQRALGLPAELHSTGTLGWDGLAEVVATLDLSPAHTLLDLACGRGGYGLEIIRRTGARMVGIDFSAVAIQQARRQAEAFGLTDRAEFRLAAMVHTGLRTASVDVVLCVDSIHFVDPVSMALRECQRVLKPGGRAALIAWQVSDNADEQIRRRLPHRDLGAELEAVGFEQVRVTAKPEWCTAERAMWVASSIETGDDPALCAMQDEAKLVLSMFHLRHRVLATAVAPPAPG